MSTQFGLLGELNTDRCLLTPFNLIKNLCTVSQVSFISHVVLLPVNKAAMLNMTAAADTPAATAMTLDDASCGPKQVAVKRENEPY